MEQRFSSAGTALNQVPETYKKFDFDDMIVLDYGCGKGKGKDYCQATFQNCQVFNFDPFNGFDEREGFEQAQGNKIICCNNVLNVLEDEPLFEVLETINQIALNNKIMKIIFKIYQGNKSGIGQQSKKDCWQRNERTIAYKNYVSNAINGRIVIEKSQYVVAYLLP